MFFSIVLLMACLAHGGDVVPVYYAVGQNTNDHMTGAPTLTIAGGTGTFSVAQTAANMGVGDCVIYNGSSRAFISGKRSAEVWTLITARGDAAPDATNAAVDSIRHPFASLSAADEGASGAAYLNTTNLTDGYVLNIPCYYDSGPDNGNVVIDGWCTGTNTYIKIYTPTDTLAECNQSQRHSGIWNTNRFYIYNHSNWDTLLAVRDDFVVIDGLQIYLKTMMNYGGRPEITINDQTEGFRITVANCILNGEDSYNNRVSGIICSPVVGGDFYIYNNIIYQEPPCGVNSHGICMSGGRGYVYNNTVYNKHWGIYRDGWITLAKNNICNSNVTDYWGFFHADSSNNISSDATSPNAEWQNRSVVFVSVTPDDEDLRLHYSDTNALDQGLDLSADTNLAFSVDITGRGRPMGSAWDIGAYEAYEYFVLGTNGAVVGDGEAASSSKGTAFGCVVAGLSVTNVFTLTNRSPEALTITGVTTNGSGASVFSVLGMPETVSGHSVGTFSIIFHPASAGGSEASFVIANDATNFTLNVSGSGVELSTNAGPYVGGNTLVITNGNFGAITNVTVGGASAVIQESGESWVRITVPALGAPGAKDIVIQTSDHGDYFLAGAYTASPREPAVPVYYAVGQNTNDHMTGTPTLTIAGGTGTFSVAQTAVNMGVGDCVTYNGSSRAFISGKRSAEEWTLITAQGDAAPDVTDAAVDSIRHPFASLSAAESGAAGAAYLNTTNLTYGFVLNIPCYYDSGPERNETTISGWNTGTSTYIRIYTPTDTGAECNQRQRHEGVWTTNRFYISRNLTLIFIQDSNVRIEGVQGYTDTATLGYYGNCAQIWAGYCPATVSHHVVSDCILNADDPYSNRLVGILTSNEGGGHELRAHNNIIYQGILTDTNASIGIQLLYGNKIYAYNNTIYGKGIGIQGGSTMLLKNNICKNNGYDYDCYSPFIAGSTNNISSDATSPNAECRNKSVVFMSEAAGSEDFRLHYSDTNALDQGLDLSADSYIAFSDDTAGRVRPLGSAWDIGAYEAYEYFVQGTNGAVVGDEDAVNLSKGTAFGSMMAGLSVTNVFTLTNRSPEALTITGVTTNGAGASAFSVAGLPETVSGHSVGTFSIIFHPASAGSSEASFVIANDATNFTLNVSGSGVELSTNAGPYVGGNTLVITNGNFGAITNVTVGGASAVIQESGESWVRITVPALGAPGAKDIVIQTSDHGDYFLAGAYTASPREPAVPIYYAVGQNTNDHMTGTPTLTITDGTGTFSVAQTAVNMGVGDCVTYNGSSRAFISGKRSAEEWTLITAQGDAAPDVTDAAVDSIRHPFASLSAAESGAAGAAYLNTTNLTYGFILNIPCYYDSGPDTTCVTIDRWTTGTNTYIKIYTPKNTATECNQSQRHSGVWNTNKYHMYIANNYETPLYVTEDFVVIDGLQIHLKTLMNHGGRPQIALHWQTSNYCVTVANCIISAEDNFDNRLTGIDCGGSNNLGWYYLYNNIIYQKSPYGSSSYGMNINSGIVHAYNNTIYNKEIGIHRGAWGVIAKNNICISNGTDYVGSFSAESSNNISSDASSPNVEWRNRDVVFMSEAAGNEDFRLHYSDTNALDQGLDLSADTNLAFSVDIAGRARPLGLAWDIGAYEAYDYFVLGTNGAVVGDGEAATENNGTDFGHQAVGGSFTHWFTITNRSGDSLNISGWATNGPGAPAFTVSDMPGSIEAHTTNHFAVQFHPAEPGTYAALLLIENDATNFVMNLSGSCFVISPTNGPLAGGNTVLLTNGYFGNITNVIVGAPGTGSAILGDHGTTWCAFVMPAASTGGAAAVIVQTSDRGDITLEEAYTYMNNTLVVLYDFYLREQDGQVIVCWETASEDETVGFDLYREVNGVWVKVNESLIPSENPMGASYQIADPGANASDTFRYRLVEYETTGTIQEYGPFDRAVWTLRMQKITVTSEGVILRWMSRKGEYYELQRTLNWAAPLTAIAHDLPATPPMNVYTDAISEAGAAFYRIGVEE